MTDFDFILQRGVFAVIRLDDLSAALPLAQALAAGGVRGVEFTLTNRDALGVIARVRSALGEAAAVGLGTVTAAAAAREAVAAGAQFLVTPALDVEVARVAAAAGVPVMMGALSPTEILAAWRAGAELVKVFPARLGGPAFFKDILGPFPQVRLIPSGGVDLQTSASYIKAGASGVAVGGALVNEDLIRRQAWDDLTVLARRFVEAVAAARREPRPG